MIFELIAWGIAALVGLSFFGISLPDIVNSPVGQENFFYVWGLVESGAAWIGALIESLLSLFS